jgi:hypothetical protein
MSEKIYRKYNSDYRKKLITKINKLTNKSDFIDIYNIITQDIGTNFSSNMNGLFFNLNILSDLCIECLESTLKIKLEPKPDKIDIKINATKYYVEDNIYNIGYKLNNQEKTIFKKIRTTNAELIS